jgi:hypothetical protein
MNGGHSPPAIVRMIQERWPGTHIATARAAFHSAVKSIKAAQDWSAGQQNARLRASDLDKPETGMTRWRYDGLVSITNAMTGETAWFPVSATYGGSQSLERVLADFGQDASQFNANDYRYKLDYTGGDQMIVGQIVVVTVDRVQ